MATERAQSLAAKYGIDGADLNTRLSWVQLSDDDLALIRDAAVYLEPEADAISKEFYEHSFKFPAFAAKITESGSNRETLEGAQAGYFRMLLQGKVDQAYMERVLFVGELDPVQARRQVGPVDAVLGGQ